MLSKIFWILCSPLTLIALVILIGLFFPASGRVLTAGATLFVILAFLPIGPNLIVYLESKYEKREPDPESLTGIVVLGGIIDGEKSDIYQQISLNDEAERLTEMIRLSRLHPEARVIFSGGSGGLTQSSPKESEKVSTLLKNLDIDTDRFEFESASRNTYENMAMTKALVKPQTSERWLLVTSAFHMPRAMAIFDKGNWKMEPYPAGYIEKGRYHWRPSLDVLGNFYKLQVATKEIVGIIAYGLTGKI